MNFVGYDPAALTAFAQALATAAAELETIARSEAVVGNPLRRQSVHEAVNTLAHWGRRARGVATCEVMERVHHVELAGEPADIALRNGVAHAWSRDGFALVQVDEPLDAVTDPTASYQAAANLLHTDQRRPLSDDDLRWLTVLFHTPITVIPLGAITVIAQRLASRVSDADRLGQRDPLARSTWAAFLGAVAGHRNVVQHLGATLPVPAAAQVVAASSLRGQALGIATADMFDRWERERWWVTGRHVPLNVADHLLAGVVSDTQALAVLWERRQASLGILFYGPNDSEPVATLIRAWTDPRAVPMPVAAHRLTTMLNYATAVPHATAGDLERLRRHLVLNPGYGDADEVRWWSLRSSLGMATAPWQLFLTTGHTLWGGSSGAGLDTVRWLMEAAGATSVFAQELGPALERRAAEFSDNPQQRRDTIDRMAWTIGAVDALVLRAEQSSADGAYLMRSLLALSVGHAAGAVAGAATAAVAPPLAGVVRTVSAGQVTQALDGHSDSQREERARLASFDRRTTAAAALMAVVVADQRQRGWISDHVPAPPVPRPVDARDPGAPDELASWLADLERFGHGAITPAARRELQHVLDAVVPADRRAAIDRGRHSIND